MIAAAARQRVNWGAVLGVAGAIALMGSAANVVIGPINALAEDRAAIREADRKATAAETAVSDLGGKLDAIAKSVHRTEVDVAGIQSAILQLREGLAKQQRDAEADRREIVELVKRK